MVHLGAQSNASAEGIQKGPESSQNKVVMGAKSAECTEVEFNGRQRGLRCRVGIGCGDDAWRGVTWVTTLECLRIEVFDQSVQKLCEGSPVTVHLDSSVLGQMTLCAKVTRLTFSHRSDNSTSVLIEVVPAQSDEGSRVEFQARMDSLRPLIVRVGFGETWREGDFYGFRAKEANTLNEVARIRQECEVAVVVVGPAMKPLEVRKLLEVYGQDAISRSIHIVLYDDTPPSAFQDLVDEDALFYLAHASIGEHDLRTLIAAALRRYAIQSEQSAPTAVTAAANKQLAELCLRLSGTSDLPTFTQALSEELTEFLQATQARCLLYDPQTDTLCVTVIQEGDVEPISAVAGLVGYVARTGERVRIEQAGKDPRYDPEADNPDGNLEAHFIAQALRTPGGATMGVLTATRAAHLSPFTQEDENRIESLAERASTLLQLLLTSLSAKQVSTPEGEVQGILFRKEALEYEDHGKNEGNLLWGIPLWLTWSHLLIVAFLTLSIGYVLLAKVQQVASGPAVIRVVDKTAVPALSSGVVARLLVSSGDRVIEGQLLATLQSSPGDSLLARMREEVRAPVDGVVNSINIRAGQQVHSGDQVLSLSAEGTRNEVLVLLPGSYAPQIHKGMPLVLKINGYPQSRERLTILDVAPDIIGPDDAERYVGKEIAQTLSLSGPIVMVRTALPLDTFESFDVANERFRYRDGMLAQAEVSVRKQPLIIALVPGLDQIYGDLRISLEHTPGTRRSP